MERMTTHHISVLLGLGLLLDEHSVRFLCKCVVGYGADDRTKATQQHPFPGVCMHPLFVLGSGRGQEVVGVISGTDRGEVVKMSGIGLGEIGNESGRSRKDIGKKS